MASAPLIHVIGIGADGLTGLRPEQVERIRSADFLAGGERHLACFPEARGQRFVIKDNLLPLIGELAKRFPQQQCVVLASGDPLFYGVGVYLTGQLNRDNFHVEPALSSMQLAFARARFPWQYAAFASIHGRDLRTTLLPLLGKPTIGLFTQDGNSPAAVARFFLERGLAGYQAFVGEGLGAPDEKVSGWMDLEQLVDQQFATLNYLILLRRKHSFPDIDQLRSLSPGIPDDAFIRPEDGHQVMTRQEVRSVLLGKLGGLLQSGDTVWDIGAGLGTVSVEIAVLRPEVEVVAVERDPNRAAFLRQNRERFDAYNIRVIEGTAPDALVRETESPRLIFIGGSGPQFAAILDQATDRLRAGGRLLANFVTLENLMTAHLRLTGKGWPTSITEIQVARSDKLGEHTGLKPLRGVFMLCADKPGVRQ